MVYTQGWIEDLLLFEFKMIIEKFVYALELHLLKEFKIYSIPEFSIYITSGFFYLIIMRLYLEALLGEFFLNREL